MLPRTVELQRSPLVVDYDRVRVEQLAARLAQRDDGGVLAAHAVLVLLAQGYLANEVGRDMLYCFIAISFTCLNLLRFA